MHIIYQWKALDLKFALMYDMYMLGDARLKVELRMRVKVPCCSMVVVRVAMRGYACT